MAKSVVGLVPTSAEAERVVQELQSSCGCRREDIGLMARGEASGETRGSDSGNVAGGALTGAGTGAAVGGVLGLVAGVASLSIPGIGPLIAAGPIASALAGAGIGAAAGGLIGGLTQLGVPEHEAHYFAEGVRRGGTLITVNTADESAADCAANVLRDNGAVDIDERAAQWKEAGWSGRLSEQDETLPVAEEELAVGKQEVSAGSVRVSSHVVERPVEKQVELREEHAEVERQRVDRPVAPGEDPFKEKSLEVRESAEEPVVQKSTRVKEEVHVGKRTSQRQQAVRDTVRKTEVDVQGAQAPYQGTERRKNNAAYGGQDRRAAFR